MTQEDRELLLKDLNARLHCGVVVTTANPAVKFGVISGISIKGKISVSTKDADIVFDCTEVRPYLRPMSDMTEKEKKEYTSFVFEQPFLQKDKIVGLGSVPMCIDWLNQHYLDYRGLIEKGLALRAPDGTYNIREQQP